MAATAAGEVVEEEEAVVEEECEGEVDMAEEEGEEEGESLWTPLGIESLPVHR